MTSEELGDFRLGIRFNTSNTGWKEVYLEDSNGEIVAPESEGDLLESVPNGSAFFLEAKDLQPLYQTLKLYFGDVTKGFDPSFSIHLIRDTSFHGDGTKWISDESNSQSSLHNFSSFRGSYWGVASLMLYINLIRDEFLHQVGGLRFQRKIPIAFDEWRKRVCLDILSTLCGFHEQINITSPLYEQMSIGNQILDQLNRPLDSEVLELYYRIEAFFSTYYKNAISIISNPSSEVVSTPQGFHLVENELYTFEFGLRIHQIHSVDKYKKIGKNVIPQSFFASVQHETWDISENRFLVYSIERVIELMGAVSEKIKNFIDEKMLQKMEYISREPSRYTQSIHFKNLASQIDRHDEILKKLVFQKEVLRSHLALFKTKHAVRGAFSANNYSTLFQYEERYSRLRVLHSRIMASLNPYRKGDISVMFQLAPFNELYQYWCFLEIVNSLADPQVGFFESGSRNYDPLYKRAVEGEVFCEMKHSLCEEVKLRVWYEKRYYYYSSRQDTQEKYGYMDDVAKRGESPTRDEKNKHRPDIVLEFWSSNFKSGRVPLIITFDPTINVGRQHILNKKYCYLKNIQSFDSLDDDRSGRALRICRASWAIFPGKGESSTHFFQPKGNHAYGSKIEYSIGNIHLHPKNVDGLPGAIKQILTNTVFLELGLGQEGD